MRQNITWSRFSIALIYLHIREILRLYVVSPDSLTYCYGTLRSCSSLSPYPRLLVLFPRLSRRLHLRCKSSCVVSCELHFSTSLYHYYIYISSTHAHSCVGLHAGLFATFQLQTVFGPLTHQLLLLPLTARLLRLGPWRGMSLSLNAQIRCSVFLQLSSPLSCTESLSCACLCSHTRPIPSLYATLTYSLSSIPRVVYIMSGLSRLLVRGNTLKEFLPSVS